MQIFQISIILGIYYDHGFGNIAFPDIKSHFLRVFQRKIAESIALQIVSATFFLLSSEFINEKLNVSVR